MICCQFIFKPGTYDEDFHRLDGQIDEFARALPGFERTETWFSEGRSVVNAVYYFADLQSVRELARFPQHQEAKSGRLSATPAGRQGYAARPPRSRTRN